MNAAAPATSPHWTDLLKIDWRLRYYDIAFCFFAIIYYILIRQTHLPFSPLLAKMFVIKGLELVGAVFAVATVIVFIRILARTPKLGFKAQFQQPQFIELIQPYFNLTFLFLTIKRIACILGAIYFFLHLKHLVLWLRPANYDLFFWNLDRKLHFGVQPNVWAMETFGDNDHVAVLLDWLYIKYFTYKLIVSVGFLLEPRGRRLSDAYFLAYTLLWFGGGLAYLAMPADGPCFSILGNHSVPAGEYRTHFFAYPVAPAPEEYVEKYKNSKIYIAKFYQERLWEDRWQFLSGKSLPGVFYGIAAMPSLHVAAVTMLMIFLFRASVLTGLVGVCYVVSTFLGSIFLQWHFAIDGYIGAILGTLVSVISLKAPDLWKDRK